MRLYPAFPAEIARSGMGSDWTGFRRALSKIKKAGFYLSINEVEPQIAGLAVPISNSEGDVLAAVALAGSIADFERIGTEAIRTLLLSAAAQVTAELS
jgi:DNA-binding IclR family transcriptional regulator